MDTPKIQIASLTSRITDTFFVERVEVIKILNGKFCPKVFNYR